MRWHRRWSPRDGLLKEGRAAAVWVAAAIAVVMALAVAMAVAMAAVARAVL